MASRTNTTSNGGTVPASPSPVRQAGMTVAGSSATAFSLWIPTARNMALGGNKGQRSQRTSTAAYIVGVKENITVTTSTGLPWQWRRVVFSFKGPALAQRPTTENPTITNPFYIDDGANGLTRTMINQNQNSDGARVSRQLGILFQGSQGIDWTNVMTAPTDTARISVMSDRIRNISSGNSQGVLREYKLWHSVRKNVVYDDEESGNVELSSYTSTAGKPGVGDVYIADFFTPGIGGAAADLLYVEPTAVLYWHEK